MCPSFEQLIDYVDQKRAGAVADGLSSHLATGCPACCEIRDWYEVVSAIAASDDSVAPPQWAFNRVMRIFDKRLQRPRLAERIGRGVATLVFDSFARPAMAGIRSTETATRQLLYRAGDYSIDLRITPTERTRVNLMGQVLKESDPTFEAVSGLKVEIRRGDDVVHLAVTDELGELKVIGVAHGVYDLRVELAEASITISDLPIS